MKNIPKLTNKVSDDAAEIIAKTSSKKELKRLAAVSRASVDDLGIVSGRYTNLRGSATKFDGVEMLPDGKSFVIKDPDAYLKKVKRKYEDSGNPLNPKMEALIREQAGDGAKVFDNHAGIPGLHAEVQSVNDIMNKVPDGFDMKKIDVSTVKVAPSKGQGADFPACTNCGGILSHSVNILTGVK